jgi:hypothetical protein
LTSVPLLGIKTKDFFLKDANAFFAIFRVLDNATNAFDAPKARRGVVIFIPWDRLPNFFHEKGGELAPPL